MINLLVLIKMNVHVKGLPSKIHGMGIFSNRNFCSGETICFMEGKEVSIGKLKKDHFNLLQVDEYIYDFTETFNFYQPFL